MSSPEKIGGGCEAVRRLGITLFLFITQAFGTTYYVSSSSGLDSNTGKSSSSPWQTITKVNSPGVTYAAGDSILFKAGDTWSGSPNFSATLTTPYAGSSGSPITYGVYGTGAAPVLDGGGTLGTVMNITKNYITVNGLQVQNVTSILISFSGTTGTQILNVIGSNSAFRGFYGGAGTGPVTIDHTTYSLDPGKTMSGDVFHTQGATGTTVSTFTNDSCDVSTQAPGQSTICFVIFGGTGIIQYDISHGSQQAFSIKPQTGVSCTAGSPATTGGLIADNYADGAPSDGNDGENIEVEGCPAPLQITGVTVARNIIVCNSNPSTGSNDALGLYQASNNFIYGNLLIGPCPTPVSSPRILHISSLSANNVFYNNTITGGTGKSGQAGVLLGAGDNGGNVFENNIFENLTYGVENASSTPITDNYNIYAPNVTTPLSNDTMGNNSKIIDPKFANTPVAGPNDCKLQPTSPAINAGATNLGSTYAQILGPSPTTYPYGSFTQGPQWMVGAFGFLSTLPSNVPRTVSGAVIRGAIIP